MVLGAIPYSSRSCATGSMHWRMSSAPWSTACPAFLTPIVGFSEQDCPGIKPAMHQAFNTIRGDAGIVAPPGLVAHRNRMFEQHLPFPIRI